MPLSFLANLGSGIARLGSAFGRGAVGVGKSAGQGIGRGFKRLGELGEDESGMFRTPDFNPNAETGSGRSMMDISAADSRLAPGFDPRAGRGVRLIEDAVAGAEDAVAGAENAARSDLPDLPIDRRDLPIPSPIPTPTAAPSFSGLTRPPTTLPNLDPLRRATPTASGSPSMSPAIERGGPAAEMDLDRRNIAIPRLPGHAGGPIPYNQIDAAKYDSVMSRARRDAEGNLLGKAEGGGFDRDWKTVAQNVLRAAAVAGRGGDLGAALGGAIAGGVGSAVNPQAGHEFAFDAGQRPRMEAEMTRERAASDRANLEILNQAKLEGVRAETGLKGAQANKSRADVEIGRAAEERQRLAAESDRRLNEAKILAELTGVERVEDIFNPETGAFERVAIFPGGKTQVIGRSGDAEMKRREILSREKISREGDAAATGRTAMGEAGEDRRQQKRLDAEKELAAGDSGGGLRKPSSEGGQGSKTATMSRLREFYKSKGITDDAEIRRRAKEHGVTVKD